MRVVDYKTGGAPREAFEARALFQLKFYALVLWRTRGVVPRVLRLLYLKDAEVCDYSPDAEELARFERTLVALWRAIDRATAGARTSGPSRAGSAAGAATRRCARRSAAPRRRSPSPPAPRPADALAAAGVVEPPAPRGVTRRGAVRRGVTGLLTSGRSAVRPRGARPRRAHRIASRHGRTLAPVGRGRPLARRRRCWPSAPLLVELVIAGAVRPDENWVAVAGFSVLGAAGIALRRVASWWAVGLTLASLASVIVVGRSPFTSVLAFVVLTYTVAARSTFRVALAAAVALWVPVLAIGMVAGRFATEPGPSPALLVLNNALLAAVAFFVGRIGAQPAGLRPARWRNGPARRRPTRRRWPPRRSPTSAGASPASCTTSSPTTSA